MAARTGPSLGFLTAIEHEQLGIYGGYLVLNASGRPLEFHCTAPLKPSRPQQILYGPTLEPYLYGEVIGQALLEKAAAKADVICTNHPAVLAVRPLVEMPVILVREAGESTRRVDGPHSLAGPHAEFTLGRNKLAVAAAFAGDKSAATKALGELAEQFDLAEPFGRIREALKEAQQA